MSTRNSKQSKAAARERLRVQREKEAKRAKVRRQLLVAGAVVVVLAAAGGIAVAVDQANKPSKPSAWKLAAKKTLVKPTSTSGTNGSVITLGDPSNKNTVEEWEDMRCPYCAAYEQTSGAAVLQGLKDNKYKIVLHMGTFLDDGNGGVGSKQALSALGAALNVSPDAFEQFHTLLYSKAVHPDEKVDTFGKASKMVSLAQKVPALKGNTKFSAAVTGGTYDKWALDTSTAFNKYQINGTPTVHVNGKNIDVNGVPSATVMSSIQANLK
jgi:protein-disulfide isomerase